MYWTTPEVKYAIYEAMREWSLTTAYWRNRGIFNISNDAAWYDISVQLPTLRPRTVTVDQIVKEIQYHLSEPASGIAGTGMTAQFSVNAIIQAVARARNQVAIDARLPISLESKLAVESPSYGRQTVADDTVYIHRASWNDSSGKTTVLERSDLYAQDAYHWQWNLRPGNPLTYSVSDTPPLTVQLYPGPEASGSLNLLTVNSLDLITDLTTATTLGLPDDITPAVKYLAITDLVTTDGITTNTVLSQYCSQRYNQIISLARNHRSIMHAMLNGVNIALAPLDTIDRLLPSWECMRRAPQFCAALFDFCAFCPVAPSSRAVTLDVVQAAPIPQTDGAYIQLGREEINALSEYSQHYLSIKLGGDEFTSTLSTFDKFQRLAAQRSGIIQADTRYLSALFNQSENEQQYHPYAVTA